MGFQEVGGAGGPERRLSGPFCASGLKVSLQMARQGLPAKRPSAQNEWESWQATSRLPCWAQHWPVVLTSLHTFPGQLLCCPLDLNGRCDGGSDWRSSQRRCPFTDSVQYQESHKAFPSSVSGGPTMCQVVCTWQGLLALSVDV